MPLNDDVLTEIFMDVKKKEMESALEKIKDDNMTIIWGSSMKTISSSKRSSRFRGVSKNGKKWQV